MPLLHFLCLLIPYQELWVSLVHYISTDPCYSHFSAFLSSIDELSEETTCRVLEITQIDFYQQVNIAIVDDFR